MEENRDIKEKFIEVLKEVRTVTKACEITGIGRTTLYEWTTKDIVFQRMVKNAQAEAKARICDIAEGNILKAIENGDIPTSKYFLKYHHSEYTDKPTKHHQLPWKRPEVDPGDEFSEERYKLLRAGLWHSMANGIEGTNFSGSMPLEPYVEEEEEDEIEEEQPKQKVVIPPKPKPEPEQKPEPEPEPEPEKIIPEVVEKEYVRPEMPLGIKMMLERERMRNNPP